VLVGVEVIAAARWPRHLTRPHNTGCLGRGWPPHPFPRHMRHHFFSGSVSELTLGRAKVSLCRESGVTGRAGAGLVARVRNREALSGWDSVKVYVNHQWDATCRITILSRGYTSSYLSCICLKFQRKRSQVCHVCSKIEQCLRRSINFGEVDPCTMDGFIHVEFRPTSGVSLPSSSKCRTIRGQPAFAYSWRKLAEKVLK
jgi:hypothetical protein